MAPTTPPYGNYNPSPIGGIHPITPIMNKISSEIPLGCRLTGDKGIGEWIHLILIQDDLRPIHGAPGGESIQSNTGQGNTGKHGTRKQGKPRQGKNWNP